MLKSVLKNSIGYINISTRPTNQPIMWKKAEYRSETGQILIWSNLSFVWTCHRWSIHLIWHCLQNQTEISAFGFACLKRTRLAPSGSVETVLYKFHKYIEMYLSTLKTPFCNKIPLFFISFYNNYNNINCVIIVNVYPIRIYHLHIAYIYCSPQ